VLCTDGSLSPEEGVARAAAMAWPSDSNLVACRFARSYFGK
jgi:hypothetical protein